VPQCALEAEARIDAYDSGNIATIPADVVFEKIEKKYAPREWNFSRQPRTS